MQLIFCDLETYCETPITHGSHRYAEDAEVMLWSYAVGQDGPAKVWDATTGRPMPVDLAEALADPSVLTVWHNGGGFDTVVLPHALGIDLPPERIHCTLAQALAHSLPGSLGELGAILGLEADKVKDAEGRKLVNLFCKPRPKTFTGPRRATAETHPDEWAQFVEYARQDAIALREIFNALPVWNYRDGERALWELDQTINRRGFKVDLELVNGAIDAVDREQKHLAKRTHQLTGGEVESATQRSALLAHLLKEYGVDLPDLQKATLERRVNDPDLPEGLREMLAIRLQASTTSTSKYRALSRAVSADGRLKGTLQFCGAMRTGRWAGRLFQPQNLPRPTLPQAAIDSGIEAIKAGCADLVTDNVMELTSSALRGCIVAPADTKLVVADLSNIEGRVLAWLAGEQWKLAAFRAFDTIKGADGKWIYGADQVKAELLGQTLDYAQDERGRIIRKGHDLYKLAYAKSFGVSPDAVDDDQRQIGKVLELALGYEGGVGAFLTFADAYGIDLDAMADNAIGSISPTILAEAKSALEWARNQGRSTFDLEDRTWLVCESFKRSWRYAHPAIAQLWRGVADAVRKAIQAPRVTYTVRSLKIRRDGNWLRIRLPSGRYLCYPSPHVEHDTGQISYMGVNQYSRKFDRLLTYSGKLVENITQAVARDVMATNMQTIENHGYRIILTVHDEILTEAPRTARFRHAHLSAIMATPPDWADGLPLAAAGFESDRYRKD